MSEKNIAVNDVVLFVAYMSRLAIKAQVTAVREGDLVDLVVFPHAGQINTMNHSMVRHDESEKPAVGTWHWMR